jgi:hypothetical protein
MDLLLEINFENIKETRSFCTCLHLFTMKKLYKCSLKILYKIQPMLASQVICESCSIYWIHVQPIDYTDDVYDLCGYSNDYRLFITPPCFS